ncbi:MAG: PQQ-binding-like beta-propeller repeat protein [Planctomycetes bacterium]|nr:PQQ-binding-like beta-propeller repeat protein [Planctomycetota bacterium]
MMHADLPARWHGGAPLGRISGFLLLAAAALAAGCGCSASGGSPGEPGAEEEARTAPSQAPLSEEISSQDGAARDGAASSLRESGAAEASRTAREQAPEPEPAARQPAGTSPETTAQEAAAAPAPAVRSPDASFAAKPGEWPMWGGRPGRNMVSPGETSIPEEWDVESGKNILWKADLATQSFANPVIAGGKILIGSNNGLERNPRIKGDRGVMQCLRAEDGRLLWQIVHDKLPSGHDNDWPEVGICSAPVVDGDRFYYVSNRCELVCADLDGLADGNDGPYRGEEHTSDIDGDIIWIVDMYTDLGVYPHNLAASSPLVAGDLVFALTGNGVAGDHKGLPAPVAPSFIAVEKRTGKVAWTSSAPGENILHGQWSSPSFGITGGREQVIFPAGDGWIYSFDPPTGALLWKFDGNPKDSKWEPSGLGTRNSIVATPVFHDGAVYVGMGQDPEHGDGPGNIHAIRAGGSGDVTESGRIWTRGGKDFGRTISSVAVFEGLVFAAELAGFLCCLDAETGAMHWEHDLLSGVWGSPMVADGKVFIGDEDGDIAICRASRELELLGEIDMGDTVYSTPVAAGGVLYIATRRSLYAIAEPKKSAGAVKESAGAGDTPQAAGAKKKRDDAGKKTESGVAKEKDEAPPSPAPETQPSPDAAGPAGWPVFRGDPRFQACRPEKPADAPRLRWTHDAGDPVESTACIAGGRAFAATTGGDLIALELAASEKKGKLLWKYSAESGFRSSPGFHSGKLFLGDDGGIFHAVDASSGERAWIYDTEGAEIISSANFAGDRVLFGSYDACLYCLDAAAGKLVWKFETGGPVHSSPPLAGGKTFVAGCDSTLRVIDVATGEEVWQLEMSGYSAASPAVVGSVLYVGTFENEVIAVDFEAKKLLWTYRHPEKQFPFYGSAAVCGDRLVVGGRDRMIHCIDRRTGDGVWTFETKARVEASPVIAGGRVICGSSDSNLYLLDLASGKEAWRFEADGAFTASPALDGEHLVIGADNGLIYCFDIAGASSGAGRSGEVR